MYLKYGLDLFVVYVTFSSQGHIVMGSLRVEEPVHTRWSRFSTVNHQASSSNYQLSNMKRSARDSKIRMYLKYGLDLFVVYVTFSSQGHIVTGSLRVEEPVHTRVLLANMYVKCC